MKIRSETPQDIQIVHAITADSFKSMPYSNGAEPFIIDALRADGDLILSLVIEKESEIIAHIAFSPVQIGQENIEWLGLGPVSVLPSHQRQGIGSFLIKSGLKRIKERGAKGCALIGNPQYYERFGFKSVKGFSYQNVDRQYVMQKPFEGEYKLGELSYCRGFDAKVI